jgi:hypothetical protein
MAKKLSQLTAISSVGNIPANIIFGISNTASGTSNTISLLSLTTHLDSTFATDIASLANVGAGLISTKAAYEANVGVEVAARSANVGVARITDVASGQANVGAGIITVTSAYQANTGAAALAGQANVGAGLITITAASQANVGAGRIVDVATGQANVGAGLITTKAAYEANVGVEVAARSANVGASVVTLTNNISNAFNQANSAYTAANTALNISQNIQIQDYTLQLTDRGKHIYSTNTQVQTITIPNSGVVAWPTGTVIDIVLNGTGRINVATSNDVTLYVANNSTVKGYANVYPRGWATLLNVGANNWFIKGQGVD